jgi:two-component system, NarL family, response regulator DevR
MGDSAYHAAVMEGRALSADDAVDLAQAALDPLTHTRQDRAAAAGPDHVPALLSDRERAVLRLIGEGLPNKQIGSALTISERTVKSHLTSAMDKLGADNRGQAVVAAIQRGLL